MGITVNIWGVSMYTVYLFMVIILCICVYRVISNYLCVVIQMKKFLYVVNVYVFIPMVLFIIKNMYT